MNRARPMAARLITTCTWLLKAVAWITSVFQSENHAIIKNYFTNHGVNIINRILWSSFYGIRAYIPQYDSRAWLVGGNFRNSRHFWFDFDRLVNEDISVQSKRPRGGQRLLKNSYLDHPTKSDVTSGFKYVSQLVSQSEKMAFRLGRIFCYLQAIRLVFFQTEGRKMFQAHFFDFLRKTFGKREQF